MNAALQGKNELVQTLINCGANVNKANSFTGNTPLIMATKKNFTKIAQLLIENGANINLANKNDGTTALIKALDTENFDFAHFLIKNGADINKANKKGETPLMYAAGKNLDITRLLIEKGAHLDDTDFYLGFTPLMIATVANKPHIVTLLLDYGANRMITNKEGKIAIQLTNTTINRWMTLSRPEIAHILRTYFPSIN